MPIFMETMFALMLASIAGCITLLCLSGTIYALLSTWKERCK